MQELLLIMLAILISSFFFLLFYFYRPPKLKSCFRKYRKSKLNILFNEKYPKNKDIKVLIEDYGGLRISMVNIKDIESLSVLSLLFSASIFALLITLGFLIRKNFLAISISAGIVCLFIPYAMVIKKIRGIKAKVEHELPEIIDFLASLTSSGLTIDESIYYIAKNYRGQISFLFGYARNMVLDGSSLKEALLKISRMSYSRGFERLVKALIQSDEIGNPIRTALRDMSREARSRERDEIKIRAQRLEGSLMIIIFIFLFIPMISLFMLPVIPQLKLLF